MSKAGSVSGRTGGRAASARGAPTVASASAQVELMATIDVKGDESMTKDMMVRVKGILVLRLPDGRTCRLCPFKDNDFDPVEIAVHRKRVPMFWGKPVLPCGRTVGDFCYYCTKRFESRIRKSRVPHITMSEFCGELGRDVKLLGFHRTLVIVLVKDIIIRGGRRPAHVDWESLDNQTKLRMEMKSQLVKKKPGYTHYPTAEYVRDFGSLATNGKRDAGHREWTLDGLEGVLVPDKQVTRIEMNEEMSSILETEIASTGDAGMSLPALQTMQQSLASSFWSESSGGGAKAVEDALAEAEGLDAKALEANEAAKPGEHGPKQFDVGRFFGQSGALGSEPIQSATEMSSATPRSRRAPAAKAAPASRRPSGSPPAAASRSRFLSPSPTRVSDKEGGSKATKGRPKREWGPVIDAFANEFENSAGTNALLWGSEAPTKMKQLSKLKEQLTARLRTEKDIAVAQSLHVYLKKLGVVHAMIEVVNEHGMSSPEFLATYDLQVATMRLEPVITDINFPAHLSRSRHNMDISATSDSAQWIGQVSSTQLRSAGVTNVREEQERLWCEKLAGLLKIADAPKRAASLLEYFDTAKELDVEELKHRLSTHIQTHMQTRTYTRSRAHLVESPRRTSVNSSQRSPSQCRMTILTTSMTRRHSSPKRCRTSTAFYRTQSLAVRVPSWEAPSLLSRPGRPSLPRHGCIWAKCRHRRLNSFLSKIASADFRMGSRA